jgi:hypothetical protein
MPTGWHRLAGATETTAPGPAWLSQSRHNRSGLGEHHTLLIFAPDSVT